MMLKNACLGLFSTLLGVACVAETEGGDFNVSTFDQEDAVREITANLELAGYPTSEIEVRKGRTGGVVFVGGDVQVSLGASREMLGFESREAVDASGDFRQYRTNNLVSGNVGTICLDGSAFNGTLSTGLNGAIANYNAQNLSFNMVRTSGGTAGCNAVITMRLVGGSGGSAGFPAGGLPFDTVNIGQGVANLGVAVSTHVIEHEIGHCIGFRHSDFFNRSISCGQGGNEGDGGVGAQHIPGTPTGAVFNGSVMNSCFNNGSDGVFTDSDVVALQELYGGGNGDGGNDDGGVDPNSCQDTDSCGGQAPGGCFCDDACVGFGDCCNDGPCVDGGEPNPNSCQETNSCGGQAPGGCFCDDACVGFGDCCNDGPC